MAQMTECTESVFLLCKRTESGGKVLLPLHQAITIHVSSQVTSMAINSQCFSIDLYIWLSKYRVKESTKIRQPSKL